MDDEAAERDLRMASSKARVNIRVARELLEEIAPDRANIQAQRFISALHDAFDGYDKVDEYCDPSTMTLTEVTECRRRWEASLREGKQQLEERLAQVFINAWTAGFPDKPQAGKFRGMP